MIRTYLITALICLSSIFVKAQSPAKVKALKAIELKKHNQKLWDLTDDLKSTEIPEKWKNESAVILYQDLRFAYTFRKPRQYYEETVRKRIKLLDQASVDDYSKFYYTKSKSSYYGSDEFYIGLKIIKPSGEEVIIDIDKESIEEVSDEKIPYLYRSYYSSKKYYKLAVPNLQIGDVIDYYIKRKVSAIYYSGTHKYHDNIYTLNETYPIKAQRYSFTIGKELYFNFNSYNGAQKLKEKELEKEYQEDSYYRGAKSYYIEDFNREKRKAKYFGMPYRTQPCIKFQIQYIPPNKRYGTHEFIGEKGIPRSKGPSAEEIKTAYEKSSDNIFRRYITIVKKIRKFNKGVTNPIDICRLAYYHYYDYYSSGDFPKVLTRVMDKYDIDYDIIAVGSKRLGNVSDILILSEVNWIIKVNDGANSFYLCDNGKYSDFEDIPAYLQGTDGLLFDPSLRTSEVKLTNVNIPENDCSRNVLNTISKVEIQEDDKLSLEVENIGKGLFRKQLSQEHIFAQLGDYYDYYSAEKILEMKKALNESKKVKLTEQVQKGYDSQLEVLDYKIDEHFITEPAVSKNDYLNFARSTHEFKVREKYNLEGAIKKAGPSIIIKAGLLIGSQVTLDDEDRTRTDDALINMRKVFKNRVEINIPDGYSAGNLDDFNVKVDNDVSSFEAIATIEDGKVVITTEKKYKESKVSVADWPKLMTMLDAATEFTQKKLLLKKEN